MTSSNQDLNLVFSTPIWTMIVDDYKSINTDMLNYIKSLQAEDPKGINRSNVSGWHSNPFEMKHTSVLSFFNKIQKNLNKAIIDLGWNSPSNEFKITSSWSIINKKGSSNNRHIHSDNYISAAYYVRAPEGCGDILFYDPREAKVIRKPKGVDGNALSADVINIKPKEGLLVLFPSYLYHSVEENITDNERVVISFNLDIK
jgi:uncharacterized protein (TIGR02466 family)